jgi:hypothetical protein
VRLYSSFTVGLRTPISLYVTLKKAFPHKKGLMYTYIAYFTSYVHPNQYSRSSLPVLTVSHFLHLIFSLFSYVSLNPSSKREGEISKFKIPCPRRNSFFEIFCCCRCFADSCPGVQVQASGIPSPRYEWYYRPNEESGTSSDDFQWTILQEKREK